MGLLVIVVIAHIVKYPAFRFGPQYAAATGKSLIEGYVRLGRWVVALYMLSEVAVIAIIIAATGVVTAAILLAVTGIDWDPKVTGVGLIVVGVAGLVVGGFSFLDRLTKIFVGVLTVATLVAMILSVPRIEWSVSNFGMPVFDFTTFAFVIALMGFMPSGMDLSVLQSLWTVAKRRSCTQKPTMAHTITDFNFGYVMTSILAISFLLMGAGVMHTASIAPAAGAAEFAKQVIDLYTTNLGNWVGGLVGVSAFFVMFTTLMTVLDGMPRLVATGIIGLQGNDRGRHEQLDGSRLLYATMALLAAAAVLVLLKLMQSFQAFIDFVTITAFLVAPLTALLNHLVVVGDEVPIKYQPSIAMRSWSILGILIMTVLAVLFIYMRFIQ
ncbi:MAG: divalent metal cation transporter [Gammaproteobacteria bacterium]|nr:divalent metal cation transporter [Gammaproteobacteria bacterium]